MKGFLSLAWNDLVSGLDRVLHRGLAGFFLMAVGLIAGWWIYVPLHELLHAAGCVLSGGEVSRLEIAPEYGARLLATWFPWVVSGGEYAGRLSGFDTHGSDLRYLATDLAPFLLTLLPGVWASRFAARRGLAWMWGATLPFALAPFLSLTGDAYEMGSIVATRLPFVAPSAEAVALLRGDDVVRVVSGLPAALYPGFSVGAFLGLVWCFGWYWLADRCSRALGVAPLEGALQKRSHS